MASFQTTLDRFEIKVGIETKDGKIEIMNRGTTIQIVKMGIKIDMCLLISIKSPRMRKVEGMRTCPRVSSTKLKGRTRC